MQIRHLKQTFAALLACAGLFAGAGAQKVYADAAYGGQTSSSDVLYVTLSSDGGSSAASLGSLSEGTYTALSDTAGNQNGQIRLDSSVGGHMHVNLGQTIDLYAEKTDVDYKDQIGFAGDYTFYAVGGKGGNISATDYYAGKWASADGGYGSAISASFTYSTGQSITYRKGSNGADAMNLTNYLRWSTNKKSLAFL